MRGGKCEKRAGCERQPRFVCPACYPHDRLRSLEAREADLEQRETDRVQCWRWGPMGRQQLSSRESSHVISHFRTKKQNTKLRLWSPTRPYDVERRERTFRSSSSSFVGECTQRQSGPPPGASWTAAASMQSEVERAWSRKSHDFQAAAKRDTAAIESVKKQLAKANAALDAIGLELVLANKRRDKARAIVKSAQLVYDEVGAPGRRSARPHQSLSTRRVLTHSRERPPRASRDARVRVACLLRRTLLGSKSASRSRRRSCGRRASSATRLRRASRARRRRAPHSAACSTRSSPRSASSLRRVRSVGRLRSPCFEQHPGVVWP